MKVKQILWKKGKESRLSDDFKSIDPDVIFAFGSKELLSDNNNCSLLTNEFPDAKILFGSTAGEIFDEYVYDDTISITGVEFEKTTIQTSEISILDIDNSFEAGKILIEKLPKEGLQHVFVLSDGQHVNGSELVKGMHSILSNETAITGGLCGDGANFTETLVGFSNPKSGNISAIGFYGDGIHIGYGSMGGWDTFGPERVITKSESNVLYELDGKSALELYKEYLGDQAKDLPSSGLLFPLSIKVNDDDTPIVRTILNVSDEDQSMTFAGDLPVGATAQLMKANFDRLIDGASVAANRSSIDSSDTDLAVLISCVGRKLVLGQRIDEEVDSVKNILGDKTTITGFYSYGEISPFTPNAKCELHNQTMTITVFSEK